MSSLLDRDILKTVVGTSSDSLRSLSYNSFGTIENWDIIGEANDLLPWDSLADVSIDIPTNEYINRLKTEVEDQVSGFVNLSNALKTVNNWKSVKWI